VKQARRERKDLSVVWLDLANAYGSVPRKAIFASPEQFLVPKKTTGIIRLYYSKFKMRFTMRQYATGCQPLRVGIPMGCAISPLLFVMTVEMIVRCSVGVIRGVEIAPNQHLPPMLGFVDDITVLAPFNQEVFSVLRILENLFTWCCMQFKSAKYWSLTLCKCRITMDRYTVDVEAIPL